METTTNTPNEHQQQVPNKEDKTNNLAKIDDPKIQQPIPPDSSNVIPIVIFTYQRAEYLKECIETLFRYA